jgi:hypothetical protein
MAEVMNRAARRAAGIHKCKAEARRRRDGEAAASHLYPGIPVIDANHAFYPLKTFAVDLELMPALGPRLFLDKKRAAVGTINSLDGPADTDSFRVGMPFDKLRDFLATEETRRRANPIVLDDPGAPPGFTFGLLDVVTYPFWFKLIYPVKRHCEDDADLADTAWQINSNLVNIFYPALRHFAAVLTIPHFDEEPIDDAPFHNIVLWWRHREDADAIRTNLRGLLENTVPTHYVCRSRPIMDDRYALHERRPEDGEPFNLLPYLDIVRGS